MPRVELELRGQRQRIDLVLLPGHTRPVIGHAEPAADGAQRAASAQAHGVAASPRQEAPGSLTEASELRTRTILSHQLPDNLRQTLVQGLNEPGRAKRGGVVASMPRR